VIDGGDYGFGDQGLDVSTGGRAMLLMRCTRTTDQDLR
jgi:hypothetical protein